MAVVAVGIAALAGCSGSPVFHQAVSGKFVRVGGPAPHRSGARRLIP
jgi:hypothetical protein